MDASPILMGVASMLATLGGRFIVGDLTPMQQQVLRHPLIRRLVMAAMFFIVTRRVKLSILLTVGLTMLLDGLMNEQSRFCVLPFRRPMQMQVQMQVMPGSSAAPGAATV